ncbi:MAG: hypothetical protein ACKVOB_09315 [Sphingomonas sp.]
MLLPLAGCGTAPPANEALANMVADEATRADLIECALAGATTLQRTCSVDREQSDRGLVLVTRNPDGGFHRLLVTGDGRGVVAADGAEKANVTIVSPAEIDVAIGGDRYRLPATISADATRRK